MSFYNKFVFPIPTYMRSYTEQNNKENDKNDFIIKTHKQTTVLYNNKIYHKENYISTYTDFSLINESDSNNIMNKIKNDDETLFNYYYNIKDDKNKIYKNKNEKRKSKPIFAIIYHQGFIKKKKIIKRNKNNKIGYITSKKKWKKP